MPIRQKILLSAWKLSHVVSIYKGKGCKLNVENCKPVSLSNVFCKLIKTVIFTKTVKFLM